MLHCLKQALFNSFLYNKRVSPVRLNSFILSLCLVKGPQALFGATFEPKNLYTILAKPL